MIWIMVSGISDFVRNLRSHYSRWYPRILAHLTKTSPPKVAGGPRAGNGSRKGFTDADDT